MADTRHNHLIRSLNSYIKSGWDRKDIESKPIYSLFELFVFKIVLDASIEAGSKKGYKLEIRYKDQDGREVSPIKFRTGPHLPSTYGFVYAELYFPGSRKRAIEVHCGMRYEGKSTVLHECDVSILGWTEAENCRSSPRTKVPRYHKILLSIECKFYASTIELPMMRGFRGLIDEIGSSNNTQIFVTSSGIRKSGVELIQFKNQSTVDELVASNSNNVKSLRDIVVKRITDFLS